MEQRVRRPQARLRSSPTRRQERPPARWCFLGSADAVPARGQSRHGKKRGGSRTACYAVARAPPDAIIRAPMDPRIERAREVIAREAEAVRQVAERLGDEFVRATDLVLNLAGRVVTAGMGKAGIIAQKVSATLASTGTPSIFLHPAEAIHGDLGRVVKGDLLLAFSKSGETEELLVLLPHVKAAAVPIVGVTQSRASTLGRHSDIVLELGPIDEAGPYGLAPSASTTAMLALGDALALVVQEG